MASSSSSIHHLPPLPLDWIPDGSVDANLDERIEQVRNLATRSGRLTAARLADTLILAAPYQESHDVMLRQDLDSIEDTCTGAISHVELSTLEWNSVPCWHQVHRHYRFEQRILRLEAGDKLLALTHDGELAAITTPAELRSEKGCAVLQIRCFRDGAIDQTSYFFAFGDRSFCEAEGNPWKTAAAPSPLGDDIREIIKSPADFHGGLAR